MRSIFSDVIRSRPVTACLLFMLLSSLVEAQDTIPPAEDDFYPLTRFQIPQGIVLEAGAIEPLPDGTLAIATRRGDIYRVSNAWSDDPAAATFELFAQGMHEILGLSYKDGWLYATQRCEVDMLR